MRGAVSIALVGVAIGCGKPVPEQQAHIKAAAWNPNVPGPAVVVNPAFAVSAWAVDKANASGCASDSNLCQTTTCGGGLIGPCRTKKELRYRLGVDSCWDLAQGTTITFMSSDTDNTDPFPICVNAQRGGYLILKGALGSGQTFSGPASLPNNFQNLQRGNGTVPRINLGATLGTSVPNGTMIADTTTGYRTWVHDNVITTSYHATMPLAVVTLPTTTISPTENYSSSASGSTGSINFQSGDSATLFTPVSVNIPSLECKNFDTGADAATSYPCIMMQQFRIYDPAGSGVDVVKWGVDVVGYDMYVDRLIQLTGSTSEAHDVGCVNCYVTSGLIGERLSTGHFWRFVGGTFTAAATQINPSGPGIALDGDAWLTASATFGKGVALGLVAIQNATTLTLGTQDTNAELANGYAGLFLWSASSTGAIVNVIQQGRLGVDTSINSTFAATLLNSITWELNGATTGCGYGTGGLANCGTTLTPAFFDDAGTVVNPAGGAMITKVVQ